MAVEKIINRSAVMPPQNQSSEALESPGHLFKDVRGRTGEMCGRSGSKKELTAVGCAFEGWAVLPFYGRENWPPMHTIS